MAKRLDRLVPIDQRTSTGGGRERRNGSTGNVLGSSLSCEEIPERWQPRPRRSQASAISIVDESSVKENDTSDVDSRPRNPLLTASMFSRAFFTWPYPILKLGLERPLVEKDLWELDTVDSSAYNLRHFEKIWQEERRLRPLNPNLAWALLKDFHKSTWIYVQPIFFLGYSARVVQAVVLGKLIESFEGLNDQGYLWAGSIVVCGLIVLCQSHHPFQIQWRKGMQTRIGSVFAIGQKSLRLSSTHQDTSNSYGKIMNLASNDAERFLLASVFLNQLFWAPAQAIAILLTGYFLFGIPFVIGWAVFVCFFVPVQIFLAIKFAQYRSQIAEITDQRVTFVAQAVNGVRVMKMSGYEWRFLDRIQKYREKEITKIRSSNRLKAWNDALFFVSNIVISLLIFLVRIWMDEALTTVAVFQIFALVNILQLEVARAAAIAIMVVSECYVSVGRIQKFLEFPELPQESEEDITERRVQRDSRLTPSKMDDVALELSRVRCYWNKVTKSAPMQSDFGRRASYLSQKPALDMINVAFMFGQLTAVIGPVGSGKTALLLALVGELPIQHGEVCRCYDELAYASQDPWIMDGTVMENILMDLDLDEIWYDKVIRACGLYTDFDQWRDGDQTKVGSQGVQCSGGQRARIGFARALYRDADVLVADDPLSAVDARVGRQLFCEAILGLCLNRGKCVILATHQHQHVKDHRCILVTDGRLRCIGTYDACIQSSHGKLTAQLPDTESHQWNGSRLGAVMEYNDEVEGQTKEASSAPLSASLRQSHTDDKSEEVIVQGLVSNETYLNYLRAMGGLHIGFVLFAFFSLTQTGVLLTLATVGRWAERPAEQQKDWDIIGLVLSLGFFVVIMAFCRAFLSFHLCIKATKLIHDKMAKSVLLARIEFFDTNPLGRIMNRFSADVGSNDDLLPPTLVEFFTLAFILAGTIVTAVINLPFVLLSLPPLWWYFAWVRKIFVTSSRELKRLECIARSPIYVELSQSLGGLATIRSNHTLDFFREKFVNVQEAHTRTVFAFIAASRWFGFRVDATMFLFLAVVCLGSVLFQEQGWFDVNPTILGLVVSFLLQFAGMFQWCMRLSAEAVNQMVSVERVLLFGQLESEAPLTLDTDKALVDRGWPVDARIEMRDLSARYRSNLPQTLKNVSFVVPAGCRVGVVGRTGSGKSTLIQALFRLLEADSGGITIDGVDISTLGLHTLRTQISVIPQTPTLFSGCSIRENLDLFNLHTDDEIDKVLFDCRLRPVVDFMPEGWDTLVTEGGQNFSVGQRQLLCLARAILSHCKILVLDEATASIDHQTEDLIQEALDATFHGATIITVAHRLETVIDNEYVLVLDQGDVVDFGTPADLLRKEDGAFHSMVSDTGSSMAMSLRAIALRKERESKIDAFIVTDSKRKILEDDYDSIRSLDGDPGDITDSSRSFSADSTRNVADSAHNSARSSLSPFQSRNFQSAHHAQLQELRTWVEGIEDASESASAHDGVIVEVDCNEQVEDEPHTH